MNRIVTNIIDINDFTETPCESWINRFNGETILDMHELFIDYFPDYDWLYEHSNIDLVRWEIENNCFDWKNNSWAVAKYCPDKFDPDKYNWKEDSWAVAKYCPDKFDPDKFNWENQSYAVAEYCQDKLDPDKFNWKRYSMTVAIYCPEKIDPEKFDWDNYNKYMDEFYPDKKRFTPDYCNKIVKC